VLQHHPHGALTHFGGKLRGCPVIRHGSSLSRVGASDKPGAVQEEFYKLVQVDAAPQGLSVELNDMIQNLPEVVEYMIYPFYRAEHMKSGLYQPVRDILDNNVCLASGLPFNEENRFSAKLIMPSAYKGSDVVATYLRDSPLMQVFE